MSKKLIKILSAFLTISLLISFFVVPVCAKSAYSQAELLKIADDLIKWKKSDCGLSSSDNLLSGKMLDSAGSTSCDWYVIGMSRLGIKDDYAVYLSVLKNNVQSRYSQSGKLSNSKSTEWHRISLAVLAAGGDPLSFGKDADSKNIDLIADGVYNRGKTASLGKQGINGWIWGLISLDSLNYTVPSGAFYTRDDIISQILAKQLADGGFCLMGDSADPDVTAMAIQALSRYYNKNNKVTSCINKALVCLSKLQLDTGDFKSFSSQNVESAAQVIVALCSLGINPLTDGRFIKNGNNPVSAMMSYRRSDGGFVHSMAYDSSNPSAQPDKSNSMAGEQVLCAIASLVRLMKGQTGIYDFTDTLKKEMVTKKEAISKKYEFSSSELKKIDKICKNPTIDDYSDVLKYIDLISSSDFEGKDDYLKKLNDAKQKIDKAKNTVDEINNEVKEKISPSENAEKPDEKAIKDIEEKIEQLDEADREKIENTEDLHKAAAKADSNKREIIIAVALGVFVAAAVCVLIVRAVKKKKSTELIISDD